jgi:hypothetical protein
VTYVGFTGDDMFRDYTLVFINNPVYTVAFSIPGPSSNPPINKTKVEGWFKTCFFASGIVKIIIIQQNLDFFRCVRVEAAIQART